MRSLKLHTKTTLLASAIVVFVLAAMLWFVSVRVAEFVRQEQRELAELQATTLAEHLSNNPQARDADTLTRTAQLVREGRPRIATVRIWERDGGVFREVTAAHGSLPATEIPEETRTALRSGAATRSIAPHDTKQNEQGLSGDAQASGEDGSLYRVFAPVMTDGRVSGAVEIVERLDDVPTVAMRYRRTAVWLAVGGVALIGLTFLLLFRFFVDRPVARLLNAMRRAEAGDFEAALTGGEAEVHDELGRLAAGYNRMIGRVREMTKERERQQAILEERVREATRELAERNIELEAANDNLEAASQELWQTTRRLTQLERLAAAEQTAAQFAHEVGTPLNLISGHIQLLQMKCADDERAASRLDLVGEQIERISGIVRRMLDRTRPEAVTHTALDLASLLRRTCDALLPTIEAQGVRLIDEIGELPPINGDADRLQQVVINLTNNALDAMPEGGELRISAKAASSSSVIVEFADTGVGMMPEAQARIFDPLYTTKERGRGTGLGLVVVRQVMREHGGEVEVASEAGKGAEFRLSFPVGEERINGAK
ncbi:MAG: HAMP domain-containing protein [Pyrinomonadaceae bacterium]|nr:HAMP domain-containing protein [Pyrinomonadaceae bacterium]